MMGKLAESVLRWSRQVIVSCHGYKIAHWPRSRAFGASCIQARAVRDAAFRKQLLQEAVDCMLAGDVDIGKTVLRDYVNATFGFDAFGAATH